MVKEVKVDNPIFHNKYVNPFHNCHVIARKEHLFRQAKLELARLQEELVEEKLWAISKPRASKVYSDYDKARFKYFDLMEKFSKTKDETERQSIKDQLKEMLESNEFNVCQANYGGKNSLQMIIEAPRKFQDEELVDIIMKDFDPNLSSMTVPGLRAPIHLIFMELSSSEKLCGLKENNLRFYIFKSLVDKGADIHNPDNLGVTPLHKAFKTRNLDLIELLLKKGASINEDKSAVPMIYRLWAREVLDEIEKVERDKSSPWLTDKTKNSTFEYVKEKLNEQRSYLIQYRNVF